jgi:hypothetical protein
MNKQSLNQLTKRAIETILEADDIYDEMQNKMVDAANKGEYSTKIYKIKNISPILINHKILAYIGERCIKDEINMSIEVENNDNDKEYYFLISWR